LYESFKGFIENSIHPFSSLYWAVTNPRDFIINIIWQGLKYLVTDVFLEFLKTYYWQILLVVTFKCILLKGYYSYQNRRHATRIFNEIKSNLKTVYDTSNYSTGITEDEIIHEYSKQYNYTETYFRNHILPLLKRMRREDPNVKEFELFIHGRNKIAWQWGGY
jgi:hypothetical protein